MISIVIPICNEGGTIYELFERLYNVLNQLGLEWEIIFIEDSSTDEYVTSEWNDIDNEFVPYPELKMPLSIDIGFAFEF